MKIDCCEKFLNNEDFKYCLSKLEDLKLTEKVSTSDET